MSDTNAALRRVVVPAEELESLVRRGRSRGGVLTQDDVLEVITVELTPDAIAAIKLGAENLSSDIHADAEYRAHLVTVMAKKAVMSALQTS